MINPHIHAALARERAATLLAEADTARRAKQARRCRRQAATHGATWLARFWLWGWLSPSSRRLPSQGQPARGRRVSADNLPMATDLFGGALNTRDYEMTLTPGTKSGPSRLPS